MSPKISFVLPTRNRLEWIGESLTSLMDQSEKDIEIIVVDDCSDDGTSEFLRDYALLDSRVRVIHNLDRVGAGKSRNIGAALAKSDIIAQMDDDDEAPEDRAEKTIRWFEENPNSEMVNFPYVRIDYFGNIMETFYGASFDYDGFKEKGTVNYFCNPSCAYKKKSAEEVGGYGEEKDGLTDDIQFVRKWVELGKKIDFDNRVFGVKHRVLPESMMASQRGFKDEWASK